MCRKFLRSRVSIFSVAINLITRSVLLNFHQRTKQKKSAAATAKDTLMHAHTLSYETSNEMVVEKTNPTDLKYIYVENVISTKKQWPINQVRMIYAALSFHSFSFAHISLTRTHSHIVRMFRKLTQFNARFAHT